MTIMRPGTKIRFWSPRFKNRPSVEPPGLLRLVSALAIGSIVGSLVYAVMVAMSGAGSVNEIASEKAIYIAVLHFVLPFGVVYTVSTNNPMSRLLIGAYCLILSVATFLGKGYLGGLPIESSIRGALIFLFASFVLFWLFRSPKMRFYYALISGKPVPNDLATRAYDLEGRTWMNTRVRAGIEWVADRLETLVILGFVAAVIYAYVSTG